jgi:hypothetical protein
MLLFQKPFLWQNGQSSANVFEKLAKDHASIFLMNVDK